MPYFMSEEEAVAIIEERMDDIVAKMASGSTANESRAGASNWTQTGPANQPCNGGAGCNCCYCGE